MKTWLLISMTFLNIVTQRMAFRNFKEKANTQNNVVDGQWVMFCLHFVHHKISSSFYRMTMPYPTTYMVGTSRGFNWGRL